MRISLQPAYLLHRKPFRDSSQLLEVLTAEHGRISLVAKGVRRKARGGNTSALVQPFSPLLVSFSGRGEMKTLTHAELAGAPWMLRGERLFSGLYLNELMIRLLQRYDPHPMVFARYGETLAALASSAAAEPILRRFEMHLLEELGYRLSLEVEADTGEALDPNAWYRLDPDAGLVACAGTIPEIQRYQGSDLLAIAKDDIQGSSATTAKRLLRQALAVHLGDAPLRSRSLFRQYANAGDRQTPTQDESSL
ncbi:DNA repair protein RecO [Parahalioglobus pacificus]|uniref:DNA repair protein RecO n=1 Tax=Parahalioglobus pacificus TaxID=930806 RepID=A0A919CIN9_9GAMM|nr:DNA repair protein RecO [Halioglobus pacificus]NQY04045.1 DNA repair protein RecO [Halieaceae bacterium]GHD28392.1 DNA repair protein RecO [Halioglobus pacificus]